MKKPRHGGTNWRDVTMISCRQNFLNKTERELRRSVRGMRRTLSGIRTLWGAEWCQVGLDHSTTACPTLLPSELPHLYPLQTSPPPPPCPPALWGHTTSRTTMTPSLALTGWMERETEGTRERGDGGLLFTWRASQSLRIFYGVADVCGWSRSLMGSCFNFEHIKNVYWMLRGISCVVFLSDWTHRTNTELQLSGICGRSIFSSL